MTSGLLTQEETTRLYEIAAEMAKVNVVLAFVHESVELARRSRAGFEMLTLWSEAVGAEAFRDKIVIALQNLLDDEAEFDGRQGPIISHISHREADALVDKVLHYKTWLRERVNLWGGVTKLAT